MRVLKITVGTICFATALIPSAFALILLTERNWFHFDSQDFIIGAAFLFFAAMLGAAGLFFIRRRNSPISGTTGILIAASVIICALMFVLPNFLRARKRSAATRILDDLRMLDAAVDQYAIEQQHDSPADAS